ncbi:MAG TPA: alpha-N-acetylglucosaminidase, partial [Flavisolibacter sp.]|nr:alpha-N-acetylglucosaminidase [Flavisolibacter sp.]
VMMRRKISVFALLFLLAMSPVLQTTAQSAADVPLQKKEQAVYDLIKRVLPQHANQFLIRFIPKEGEKDVFEIESHDNKILLSGNNGVSIASSLHHYLKHFAHCQITWNGTNLNLPAVLPVVTQKVRITTPYKYRYYLNYCTFNYTMSWWNWERWQKEIDWMALNGINMPLAVTGQNSVWSRVYKSFGFTDKELEGFFSGPAYFNWFWMGNLDAWGGPLPQSFMQGHEDLQKKILERERSFGMTPILPAFTGHVPPSFKEKFPDVAVKKTSWVGFPEVSILDPSEPLFNEIGKRFIEEEMKTYGTDHLYTADTFNENKPPTNDSTYLSEVSKKVYQSMALADPKATWIMQGWLFHHAAKFWKPTQIKALLNAVPNDKMIVLDLWSERHPVWNRTDAYYGKPWIWNMLHNFGGNINLSGLMSNVARAPSAALHNPAAGKLLGVGLTMEAIEQNPVMYELMMENVWREEPIDLETWLPGYAFRRYSKKNAAAEKAWHLLRHSVYADSTTNGGAESIITARPIFNPNPGGTSTTKLPYDPLQLVQAWDQLLSAADELNQSDGYQFDVVDVTRQVLANYALDIQQQVANDFKKKNRSGFQQNTTRFIQLVTELDDLLASRKDFLLGNWLEAAKSWGTTEEEKSLYEKNARNLLTLWGDKNSRLHEYACRQWSGLLNGFYKKRWEQFFAFVASSMEKGKEPDFKKIEEQLKDWEWQWVNARELYPVTPTGDPIGKAKALYKKYFPEITAGKRM